MHCACPSAHQTTAIGSVYLYNNIDNLPTESCIYVNSHERGREHVLVHNIKTMLSTYITIHK